MSMSLNLGEKQRVERLAALDDTRWYDRYLKSDGLDHAVRAIEEWRQATKSPGGPNGPGDASL